MTSKVLFVDDEPQLLNTFQRNLCFDFQVSVAEGGSSAVEKFKSEGPFPVVVVDMRMPDMDGIQTISEIRSIKPDTAFIMLTGNQDAGTAIRAVNEGRVFRFLNKPCDNEEIKQALREAHTFQSKMRSEKGLLIDTMLGSLNMLTDLAGLHGDSFVRSEEIHDLYVHLAQLFDVAINTEDGVAPRVLLVGLTSLSDSDRLRFKSMKPGTDDYQQLFNKLCQASSNIVVHLPTFSRVADLLKCMPTAEAIYDPAHELETKATLLRIALCWCLLERAGREPIAIRQTLEAAMPHIDEDTWRFIGKTLTKKS